MDVPGWPTWDTALTAARADGPLGLGVRSVIVSDGREVPFEVTRFEPGESYAFSSALPFGHLVVTRSLMPVPGGVSFTHDVQFTGLGGMGLAPILGPRFRAVLPDVMARRAALPVQP